MIPVYSCLVVYVHIYLWDLLGTYTCTDYHYYDNTLATTGTWVGSVRCGTCKATYIRVYRRGQVHLRGIPPTF
jgi:hypothetical protein